MAYVLEVAGVCDATILNHLEKALAVLHTRLHGLSFNQAEARLGAYAFIQGCLRCRNRELLGKCFEEQPQPGDQPTVQPSALANSLIWELPQKVLVVSIPTRASGLRTELP